MRHLSLNAKSNQNECDNKCSYMMFVFLCLRFPTVSANALYFGLSLSAVRPVVRLSGQRVTTISYKLLEQ